MFCKVLDGSIIGVLKEDLSKIDKIHDYNVNIHKSIDSFMLEFKVVYYALEYINIVINPKNIEVITE
jgi:hypothetical protein